jgi:hypothetical protein
MTFSTFLSPRFLGQASTLPFSVSLHSTADTLERECCHRPVRLLHVDVLNTCGERLLQLLCTSFL